MEKIYLLCFTKSDFLAGYDPECYCDGGGYVILATKHLEFAQKRMREEVKDFVENRIELLKGLEEQSCDEWGFIYEDTDFERIGYWGYDGMGWEINPEKIGCDRSSYNGWEDNPKFYIEEIEII